MSPRASRTVLTAGSSGSGTLLPLIVFLGAIVGGMIVAMYLPIFDMIDAVK